MAQTQSKEETPPMCDNHPGTPAVLSSDLNGAVQPINLCEICVNNANLQNFV